MTNKIVPIGEVVYDNERRVVEIDGVIEETPNGQFVDPQKRTYVGAKVNENGTIETSGLFLRERTDAEKQMDLARMFYRDPTFVSIMRNTKISELPIALVRHAYNQAMDFVVDTTMSIKRTIRKSRLERELDRQNIPHRKGLEFYYDSAEFEHNALSYVWSIVAKVGEEYGVDSELFDEVASQLLTKRERDLVVENALRGENPRWRIATVEDRRYDHKRVIRLYGVAVVLAEKYEMKSEYGEWIKSEVETSPFFSVWKEQERSKAQNKCKEEKR